jgi:lysophospholipase L1-like esterase
MDQVTLNALNRLGSDPASGLAGLAPAFSAGAAGLRCGQCEGAQAPGALGGLDSSLAGPLQLQYLNQILQLLGSVLGQNGLGQAVTPQDGSAAPVSGTSNQGGASSTTNSASNQSNTDSQNGELPKIKSGQKVLQIGDSHTVGTFGTELEKMLEAKGANVTKEAAVGTSANHWLNGGHGAKSLQSLTQKEKPDVILINLGANFRKSGPKAIEDAAKLAKVAKETGAQVIWIGPPTTREDQSNPSLLKKFDEDLKKAVSPYATYVSSAPFTPQYKGSDGIHLSNDVAKQWAQGVAGAIS